MNRVGAGDDRQHRLLQFVDRLVEVVADLRVGRRKAALEAGRQDAGGEILESFAEAVDHLRLLLGRLGALRRRPFALDLGGAADSRRFPLQSRPLDGVLLEDVDRLGHRADLVPAVNSRHVDGQLALG